MPNFAKYNENSNTYLDSLKLRVQIKNFQFYTGQFIEKLTRPDTKKNLMTCKSMKGVIGWNNRITYWNVEPGSATTRIASQLIISANVKFNQKNPVLSGLWRK